MRQDELYVAGLSPMKVRSQKGVKTQRSSRKIGVKKEERRTPATGVRLSTIQGVGENASMRKKKTKRVRLE